MDPVTVSILASTGINMVGSWLASEEEKEANVEAATEAAANASLDEIAARDTYIRNNRMLTDEIKQIDRELRNVMSSEGLESMKAASSMRASVASTGFAGGTYDAIVSDVYYEQQFDNAVAWTNADNAFGAIQTSKLFEEIAYNNKLEQINRGLDVVTSATAQSESAGWTLGLNMATQAAQGYLQYKTL